MSNKKVISIEIKDDKIDQVLKELDTLSEVALKAIGAEAITYAQKNCPVDTGALRNSIAWATHTGTDGNPMEGEGKPSEPKGTPEKSSVYIGSNLEYAEIQEYGSYYHKVGQKHFLRDAMANHVDHYKAILQAALDA